MSSIIDRIHDDEEDYEELCELLGAMRVSYTDNFYKHYEELKNQLKEQSENGNRTS